MKKVRTWGPLLGTLIIAAVIALRAFGAEDAAKGLETVGGLVGMTGDPTVSYTELAAAIAAIGGVTVKIVLEFRKAWYISQGAIPAGTYSKEQLDAAIAKALDARLADARAKAQLGG